MIEFLQGMDSKTALGVLARAALALEEASNPAAEPILDNEVSLRRRLLSVARERVGLPQDDNSEDAIERIGEFLDLESDALVGPTDTQAALLRLAQSGSLPSEMYEIQFAASLSEWLVEPELEKDLIAATIRAPDREQHFGPSSDLKAPSLVSLFVRQFRTKWPFKDFYLLVAASRNGLVLTIGQAWRIYPTLLETDGCKNLVEVLEKFANEYGAPIERERMLGKFFLTVGHPVPQSFSYTADARRTSKIGICQIYQIQNGITTSALVLCIDLIKYHSLIKKMSVKRDEILNLPLDLMSKPKHAT